MAIIHVEESVVEYGDYDTQEGALPLNIWMKLYSEKTGVTLNPGTVRKRRAMSGLGLIVPPKLYLLTKDEFESVLATPLPMCNRVVQSRATPEAGLLE
jgi:hypothetical protein